MAKIKKIGMILECSKPGADIQVCKYAASRIAPTIDVDAIPMDDKQRLLQHCGDAASLLLQQGYFHVMIIWDLIPSLHGQPQKPCRAEEVEIIRNSLQSAGVDFDRVTLVCIEKELESWLIADHRAVTSAIKKKIPTHKVSVSKFRNPDHHDKPKTELDNTFKKNLGRKHGYNDITDAIKIAQEISDCRFVSNSSSFQRFAGKLKELEKENK